ncbi:hypothetical protein PMAYCL1PPCAC_10037, partial [Pristionchus mayeri]
VDGDFEKGQGRCRSGLHALGRRVPTHRAQERLHISREQHDLGRLEHPTRERDQRPPLLLRPADAHFGSGNQAAQHRQAAWQQIISSIGYTGGPHLLQGMWRRLKERYTRERREGTTAGEEPLDESLAADMAWLDEYVLPRMPPASTADRQNLYFMDGEEDLLGDDFVDQHEYRVESRLGEVQRRGTRSPAGSQHSGTGSDIDVGGASMAPSHPLGAKDHPGSSASHGGMSGASGPRTITLTGVRQPATSGGTTSSHNYRFVNSSSSSHHQSHPIEGMTVSSRGNGTLVAPKREGSVAGGGSTLTMVIDPTTYYQNGTQKMYRLVNVADLDQSSAHPLQHLRPSTAAGMGGGGATAMMESGGAGAGMGFSIGRGTRKRMGAPLSPPSHAGGSGMLGGPSSSADHHHHSSPYGKAGGQLGDDLILDDGIVGENTIVIDHQRDDESPLLVDSPGMHHHHLMMGGSSQRGMHRGQHSPTLLGNGSGARGSGGYSPGLGMQGPSFNTTQYDADLALQHFISSHLARMSEEDKALAKMNIQRILLDARFGTGTTLRLCMGEEDAELTDAAVAAEMPE